LGRTSAGCNVQDLDFLHVVIVSHFDRRRISGPVCVNVHGVKPGVVVTNNGNAVPHPAKTDIYHACQTRRVLFAIIVVITGKIRLEWAEKLIVHWLIIVQFALYIFPEPDPVIEIHFELISKFVITVSFHSLDSDGRCDPPACHKRSPVFAR
jgi:hypothetical protein